MNPVYGANVINPTSDIFWAGYDVDLVTRKIKFMYRLSNDVGFEFSLLSECRDDVQEVLKKLMMEDELYLGISDTESEYCNVVMFGNLPWEENEE